MSGGCTQNTAKKVVIDLLLYLPNIHYVFVYDNILNLKPTIYLKPAFTLVKQNH